jgi:hypothetical protein
VLAGRVGAYDEEVIGGRDAAVAGSRGKHGDIPGADGDGGSLLPAEHDLGVPCGEAENLVSGGVIVVKVVDAVAPLWGPAVAGEELLHLLSEAGSDGKDLAVEEYGEGVVWHPAIGLEVELIRLRNCVFG